MKLILDSSVAFKTLVVEQESDKAVKLLDEYRQGVHELLSPDILPVEVGHALTRAERQGRVSPTNGYALWSSLLHSVAKRSRADEWNPCRVRALGAI